MTTPPSRRATESRLTAADRYDLAVLGGDPAAVVAARASARRGLRVALVLPEAALPAEPAVALVPPNELARQIRQVQARVGCLTPAPPEEPGIDLWFGQPRFTSCCSLEAEGLAISFRRAIIATGRSPVIDLEGASEAGCCLTPETLASLRELPRRLAVIGCGPMACQWAQAFRRFGSEVHLLAREPTLLPDEDLAAAAVIQDVFLHDDIRLHFGCTGMAVERIGGLQAIVFSQQGQSSKLPVDQILLCGPRRPNIAALGLESAGVACRGEGLVVNERLQTSQRRILAAGEVCDAALASLQARDATARLAVHNAFSLIPRRLDRLLIPRRVDTDPQVVQMGPTRREAQQRQLETATYRVELSAADDSLPPGRRRGFIAVEVARRTGRIVGATVVAEDADELGAPLQVLISRRWPLSALAEVIPCRPSRNELWQQLAEQYAASRPSFFRRPWTKNLRREWTENWHALLRFIRSKFGGR